MISNSLLRALQLTSCVASLMVASLHTPAYAQRYNIAAQSTDLKAMLYRGHKALIQGKNQAAIALLSAVIKDPKTDKVTLAKAFLKRAVAYQRIGHLQSAITNFNFAENFRILPKSDVRDLLYNRAQVYNLFGQPKEALQDEKTLQMIDAGTALPKAEPKVGQKIIPAHRKMPARSVLKQPRRVMASKQFIPAQAQAQRPQIQRQQDQAPTVTASISAVPTLQKPQQNPLQMAHNAILYGKNKQAIQILSRLISNKKTLTLMKAQALLKRGVAYRRVGNVAASISDFTKADNLNVLSKGAQRDLLFNRAKAYKAVKKHQLAFKDEQRLLKIDGLLPQRGQAAPLTTAAIAAPVAQAQAQAQAQTLALAQTPLQKAHNAIIQGKNKQAITLLSRIIDNDKTPKMMLGQALLKRGVAYRRVGKVAASILDFSNAENLKTLSKGEQRDLLFNRAKAYKAVKMDALARKDDQSLLKIDGLLPEASDQGAPLTTAALAAGRMVGKGKKKRFVRTYKAVAQPKTLVGHIKLLMKKKK